MNYLSCLYLIAIFLSCLVKPFAQNEITTIPLDTLLGDVNEMMQFSDDQGNILFKFLDGNFCQYSLMLQDKTVKNKILDFNDKHHFLECFYNDSNFNLFYRNKKDGTINVRKIGRQSSSSQLLKTNIGYSEEKYLADFYN